MNLCRLCGEEKSPLDLNIELCDKTSSNWIYRDLIEHHSRVSLKTSKLLPQSICEDCRGHVDGFAEFSTKLQAVQNSFDGEVGTLEPQEIFAQSESIVDDSLAMLEKRPSKRKRTKQPSVGDFFKSEFTEYSSLKLQIEFLDTDIMDNGELSEFASKSVSQELWSSFLTSSELKLLHTNNQKVEISCKFCLENFDGMFECLNHITSQHAEHLKHCCLFCNRLFYDLSRLLNHISVEHDLQIFQCLICGHYSESFTALRNHSTSTHGITYDDKNDCTLKQTMNFVRRTKRIKKENTSPQSLLPSVLDSFEDSEEDEKLSSEDGSADKSRRNQEQRRTSQTRKMISGKRTKTDSYEKIFADEIQGLSRFQPSLHLNVDESSMLLNGEISDSTFNGVRWRDLLNCGICKIAYTDINDLLAHAEKKHSTRSKLFQCQACEGEFSSVCESPLINHLVERHYYEHLKFCCLVCSKIFYNLPLLMAHYKSHAKKLEVLVCLVCGWYAKNLDDLKEHKNLHSSSEMSENQKLCEKIYEKFKSGKEPSGCNHSVLDHEKNLDGTVTPECQERFFVDWSFGRFNCTVCDLSFGGPFQIFVHQRLKHPKDLFKKLYSCSLCTDKKDFTNLFTFVNHATTKHLDNAKFVCVCCSKVFWNYLALADHYRDVHPTFPCICCCHCGKIFMNVSVAASHFRTLNLLRTPEERKLLKEGKMFDEMSFICHVCARSFKNRGTLLNHEKIHQHIEQSELLQCHICSKFYKNKYKLAQHMVCHEDLRSWKCKACGQAFNYKKLLQRHIQAVHENERAFGCTFCEKRFNSKYDLKVHVRLHTGEMPYQCPISDCDAKYPAWSNLFKHCQSRHKLDIRSEGYKKLKATQKSQKNVDYESD